MKPSWLKVKLPSGKGYIKMRSLLQSVHTICVEARCPNIAECWSSKTATFLILGNICTRNCAYCNVKSGKPVRLDSKEPKKIAQLVKKLKLRYVVITSVTRDDLDDGGASIFYEAIKMIKKLGTKVEVLTPDFNNNKEAIKLVIDAEPDVYSHNIETVQSLFSRIRPLANYSRSINLLNFVKRYNPNIITKSGLMVGLGEKREEIIKTFKDLRLAGCDILTVGQYLQPNKSCLEVKKFYTPQEFEELKLLAYKLGFKQVAAGPLIRSSYLAERYFLKCVNNL